MFYLLYQTQKELPLQQKVSGRENNNKSASPPGEKNKNCFENLIFC